MSLRGLKVITSRITTLSTAFVIAASTLSGALPFLLTQKAYAAGPDPLSVSLVGVSAGDTLSGDVNFVAETKNFDGTGYAPDTHVYFSVYPGTVATGGSLLNSYSAKTHVGGVTDSWAAYSTLHTTTLANGQYVVKAFACDGVSNCSVSNGSGASEEVQVTIANSAAITSVDAALWKDTYKGITVSSVFENTPGVTSYTVDILRDDTTVATIEATQDLIDQINAGSLTGLTTPVVIEDGSYTAASSSSWIQSTAPWTTSTTPTQATVTIVSSNGPVSKPATITTGLASYSDLLPPAPVCTPYDFTSQKMWEVTWGYDFANRNGGTPVFNMQSNGGLVGLNGGAVPSYMDNDANWHHLYITDNGTSNPTRNVTYEFTDGTTRTANVTWSNVSGCHQVPEIVWGHTAPDTTAPSASNATFTPYDVNSDNTGGNHLVIGATITDDQSGVKEGGYTYVRFAKDGQEWTYRLHDDGTSSDRWVTDPINTRDIVAKNHFDTATVKFSVGDNLGNHKSWKPQPFRAVGIDNSGPGSTLTSPTSGSLIHATQRFTFTTSDDTGVNSGYMKLNGSTNKQYTLTQDGTSSDKWYADVDTTDLNDGSYTVDARFVDSFGTPRYGANKGTVVVDNAVPTAVITTPSTNGFVKGSSITIKGTATDDNFNYYYCYVSLPGSSEVGVRGADCNTTWHSVAPNGTLGTVNLAGLSDGSYEAHLVAYDKASNHSNLNYSVPFTLDNTKPTVEFTSPTRFNNSSYNKYFQSLGSIAIKATDSHGVAGMAVHTYNADGSYTSAWCGASSSAQSDTLSCDTSGLADGEYYVKAGAKDKAGNNRTLVKSFTIDHTKPVASITSPANKAYVTGTFTVTGAASDALSDIDHVTYTVNEITGFGGSHANNGPHGPATFNSTTGKWNFNVSGLSNGYYRIQIRAFDGAGNWKYVHHDVLVDNTAPTVEYFVRKSDNGTKYKLTNHNDVSFIIKFSETTTAPDISDFSIVPGSAHGTVTSVTPEPHHHDNRYFVKVTSVGGNGELQLKFNSSDSSVTDLAGNPIANDFTSQKYVIDNAGPVVTVTNPDTNPLTGSTAFKIKVEDEHLDTAAMYYIWVYLYNISDDSQQYGQKVNLSGGTGTLNVDTTSLDNGNYTLSVGHFRDLPGNSAGNTLTNTYFRGYVIKNNDNSNPGNGNVDGNDNTDTEGGDNGDGSNGGNGQQTGGDQNGNTQDEEETAARGNGGGQGLLGLATGQPAAFNLAIEGDGTPATDNSIKKVEGDSTTVPSGDNDVESDSTTTSENGAFWGLGWWWLLVLAVLAGAFWLFAGRKANKD